MSCIGEEHGVPDGLAELFRFAASDLKKRLTPDPAGVSKPIQLQIDRNTVVGRLQRAAKSLREALDNDDDKTKVQEAIAGLYWKYVAPPSGSGSKETMASALRSGSPLLGVSGGALTLGGISTTSLKPTRSYGSERS